LEKAQYKVKKIPRKVLKNYARLEVAECEETKKKGRESEGKE
jgi:hypothetical protein